MNEGAKSRTYRGTKTVTNYKAPTSGLEHIVFEYGKKMKPGSFKTMVESMAEHMAATLKYGGQRHPRGLRGQRTLSTRSLMSQLAIIR